MYGSEADDVLSSHIRNSKRASPAIRRVLPQEKKKQRVPDTEHLTRMRALLVQAHSNDSFIKNLASGNSYVPKHGNPEGSKEMGASFGAVYEKNTKRL